MRPRTILHCDLDAFYASVEQRDDPGLRGQPVIVGGPSRRGVVLAASYEVRPFGVRSAMSMGEAMKLCPHALVVEPRMERYAELSRQFFEVLESYSPLVEGLSLDEAFLDVTGEVRLFGDGVAIARLIKERVRRELELVVSVGIAPVKFAAKIATDVGKPDGLCVVEPARVREFLAPLPIGRLWGVGKVTEEHLRGMGLATIGDVARIGRRLLASKIGEDAANHLTELAEGRDDRAVEPDREPVSIGAEGTFERDVRDRASLLEELLGQADRCCARLRGHGYRARVVMIKIKYADHELVTRRITLPRATVDARVVGDAARQLLPLVPNIEKRGVRLTGVSLSGLEDRNGVRQLTLDEASAQRGEDLGDTLDKITAKFGDGTVKRAVHVKRD